MRWQRYRRILLGAEQKGFIAGLAPTAMIRLNTGSHRAVEQAFYRGLDKGYAERKSLRQA